MDYFKNSYQYKWSNIEEVTNLKMYQNAAKSYKLSFSTPILKCYGRENTGWTSLFQMNVITRIYRTETKKVEQLESEMYSYVPVGTRTIYATYYSGATTIYDANNATYYASGGRAYLRQITRSSEDKQSKPAGNWTNYYTTTSELARVQSGTNSTKIELTIPALTESEVTSGKGYFFEVECIANPTNNNAMLQYYEAGHNGYKQISIVVLNYYWTISTISSVVVDHSSCKITVKFYQQDMSIISEGGPLITKGVKYSAYQLLRKALLTTDTYIFNNTTTSLDDYGKDGIKQPSLQYPIVLDDKWHNRLQVAKINETIFEVKNLWEVFIQIGYYIHAIPYLDFAEDGTDRLVLKFKQLGATKKNDSPNTKITVFNSQNLNEYFSQYDSYVTNLFSPQNIVDEWVVCKTSDQSFLISNNTSELHLAKPITELLEFDITMKLPNGRMDTRSVIKYVFEKSIYDILSNDDPNKVFPSKGSSLYYSLGSNKIQGLYFVPPSMNSGDELMSLKQIINLIWQGETINPVTNLMFNSLQFHIKYRTQDDARINQFRPDLERYVKNSAYEKYPHHEQFYGQQDKIIDSERFTANLFGKLIRVGNGVCQCQEYATNNEKEAGDLVDLNGNKYYVTATENEFYPDAILQKVTYSKNFNQLSQIVTIPSEPRFYEVSERSKIRREVRVMDFFTLSTNKDIFASTPQFLNNEKWKNFLKGVIFNDNKVALPNYAWTRFKTDKLRNHPYPNNKMFPSSLIEETVDGIRPVQPSDHTDVIVPLLHFPLHDGMVFTWDMADNFKASEFVNEITDKAYSSMQPMRYVDIYGRADLFNFKLFNKTNWDFKQVQQLPQGIINPTESETVASVQGGDDVAIGLDKDGREEISFNYHINLLHKTSEDDDDFITFPNLFGQKDNGKLKICLLDEPQSLFNENQNITDASILADEGEINYELIDDINAIEIRIKLQKQIDLSKVKSIVIYQGNTSDGKFAYIIKNVQNLEDSEKLQSWWIYPVFN